MLCSGAPVVRNSNMNVVMFTLPQDMTPASLGVRHEIAVSGLKLPKQGTFATRFGAQVTDAKDGKPDYIKSDANFFIKEPDDGMTIAKILQAHGDGNQRPFKKQQGNVVYLKIILAQTLFSKSVDGDAGFTVTMPSGYECIVPNQYNPATNVVESALVYNYVVGS